MSTTTSPVTVPADEPSFSASREVADAVPVVSARSVFVVLARAGAILLMLQGHTLHVVLASEAHTGMSFHLWSFLRGLTSCTFLLLTGFVFTVSTQRRWADYLFSPADIGRRFRRFGFFLLIGYALHFPMAKIAHLYFMGTERWQSFLIADVLQCIAVMLAALQVLVLVTRTPRRYTIGAAVGCAAIVALTPTMWRVEWAEWVPLAAAAYLSPATGSLFPLFPWGAYILLGAVLGTVYVAWGQSYLARLMLSGGVVMAAAALICARLPLQPFGDTDFWSTSPNQFLLRSGLVLVALGLLAHISQLLSRPPFVIQALAHESLMIYAVHLCVVYGSVWNAGLRQHVGPTLTLLPALGYVAAVWFSMIAIASAWYWCKHHEPGTARWVRVATGGLLLGRLL